MTLGLTPVCAAVPHRCADEQEKFVNVDRRVGPGDVRAREIRFRCAAAKVRSVAPRLQGDEGYLPRQKEQTVAPVLSGTRTRSS